MKVCNFTIWFTVRVLKIVQLHVSCRWKWHSSHGKRFKGDISTQRDSHKSELNEPAAIADLVTLELDVVNDAEVDNQVPPDPGTAENIVCSFIVCYNYNAISLGINFHFRR